jgi:hypothetical protein
LCGADALVHQFSPQQKLPSTPQTEKVVTPGRNGSQYGEDFENLDDLVNHDLLKFDLLKYDCRTGDYSYLRDSMGSRFAAFHAG